MATPACCSSGSESDKPSHADVAAAAESNDADASVMAELPDGAKATDTAALPAAAGGGDLAPAGPGLWLLPDEEVQWVLSRERRELTSNVVSQEGVRAYEFLRDSFFKYQAWMRREYEANGGVVKVDDEFVARRRRQQQWKEEMLADVSDAVDTSGWEIYDNLSDYYDTDEEEEEEVVEKPKN